MRCRLPIIALALSIASLGTPASAADAAKSTGVPKLGHVFVIVLENENAAETFGPDAPPYLARTLPAQGAYVPNYYATGHFSLDNYISMVSGQAPNPATQADCNTFSEFAPGIPAADGQVIGIGCVYPTTVHTIGNQLEDEGLDWGGYMEDMAAKAPAEPGACRHPAIGGIDDTQAAEVGDQYATRHNPFMYFHAVIDDNANCAAHDVDLTELGGDLSKASTTPEFSFITPNLCHDGHDEPCVNGEPGGLVSANAFLERTVPAILKSPAFEDRGLLIVTFDEAEAAGAEGDSTACCNEQPGPNTTGPGFLTPGPGGGRIGAVMISPCIAPGTTTQESYNHYSFLRSVEDGFGLGHLGYAGQPGLRPFGTDIYTRPDCGETMKLKIKPAHPKPGEGSVRLLVKSELQRCREGVRVSYAGAKGKTNANGKVKLKADVGAGTATAKAKKEGCLPARLKVKPRY